MPSSRALRMERNLLLSLSIIMGYPLLNPNTGNKPYGK
jgi:hypothetical protein